MAVILVCSDCHLPFEHPDLLAFYEALKRKFKPDHVVFTGDLMDQYSLGKWARHPNAVSVGDEIAWAKEKVKPWIKLFHKCTITIGNHESRLFKRGLEAGVPEEMLIGVNKLLDTPKKWEWCQRAVVEGITFFHGDGYSGESALLTLIKQFRAPVVIGHLHSLFGVQYLNNGHSTAWAACFGCGVDVETYAFQYSKHFKNQPIVGAGVIIDGVPVPIPMPLDKHGRWTGVV